MKRIILFLLLTLAISQLQAQSYLINFTGSGLSNTVDSVYVQNLVKVTELTMSGSDTLWLDPNVGIKPIAGHNDNLQIYPNPLINTSKIEFYTSQAGSIQLEIMDAAGRTILQKGVQLPQGTNIFSISGLKAGIYIVEVITNDGILTGRIIAACGNTGDPVLSYESSSSQRAGLKSTMGIVGMRYDAGEILLFRGTSGKYKRVVTLVPTHNQAVDFDFISCSDPDNNNYAVVTIGTQTWMAEDLKTKKFNDASPIPLVNDNSIWGSLSTPAYCVYDTNDVFKKVFGCLYNFYAVNAGILCPSGWHAPTTVEWTTLTDNIGGENVAGGKLKEVGTLYWLQPNAGATNETGFSARGGGARYNGLFNFLGRNCYWWSSTEYNAGSAWYRYMMFNDMPVLQNNFDKTNGFYVRCVKD